MPLIPEKIACYKKKNCRFLEQIFIRIEYIMSCMKTPLYQEVKISTLNLDHDIEQGPWGEGPLYINFPASSDTEFQKMALARLKQHLKSKNISTFFPYPIYVISTLIKDRSEFPILASEKQLPKFFHSKRRELTSKEIPFLKKIQILAKKVQNGQVEDKLQKIKSMGEKNRQLFDLTCETYFYQTIRRKLKLNEKTKRADPNSGKRT